MMATKELYAKARPVLERVMAVTRERQSELVSEECGDDEPLARFVRSLLRQRDNIGADDGSVDVFNVLKVSINDDEVPEALGSYRIIRRLGAGGMSVVYLAEQANPRRLVAVKVLRRQTVKREVLQHEVETLALLRHPGIGQIYEAGVACTPDGDRPYFVMEFISSTGDTTCGLGGARAETLLEYAAGRPCWTVRERLEVVAGICDAVDYAHKRGVIHRDLKPANVLMDHLGQPKVIDFGVSMLARGVDGEPAGAPAKVLAGTLPYMSPEQLAGDASKIDVRSDVYALGILAFELLSGVLPFNSWTGDRQQDLAMLQKTELKALTSETVRFPRDVQEIVAKAMAKDPAVRYQSAAELATDIRRFVAKKPVTARKNTIAYRGMCLVRRRPAITAAAAVAGILISVASIRAYRANAGALDTLALLERALVNVDPITLDGSPATLERLLDSVSAEFDSQSVVHRGAAGQIQMVLGSLYLRQDPRLGPGSAKAATHYRKAAELLEQQYGRADSRTIQARNNLAMALSKSGDAAGAQKILEELLPLRERNADEHGRLVSLGNHAVALLRQGRLDDAMTEFSQVFDGFAKSGDLYEALKAVAWQARVLMEAGHLADAERIQRDVLARSLAVGPMFSDLSLAIMDGLTHNLITQRKWREAKAELIRMREFVNTVAAADHKLYRSVLTRLQRVHGELGEKSEHLAAERDLEAWEAEYGERS